MAGIAKQGLVKLMAAGESGHTAVCWAVSGAVPCRAVPCCDIFALLYAGAKLTCPKRVAWVTSSQDSKPELPPLKV